MTNTARSGAEALTLHAPEVAAQLTALSRQVQTFDGLPLVASARAATVGVTGLRPLPGAAPVAEEHTAAEAIAVEVAEQMALDVSGVTEAQRAALTAALGRSAHSYLLTAYLADWIPRALDALDALFGESAVDTGPLSDDRTPLWSDFVAMTEAVGRLRELDPVLTELIRLRMAREHNCALCKSLRNRTALESGGQESDYSELDSWRTSTHFDARTRAALALTDTLIWTPAALDEALVAELRTHFSAAQQVELILDLLRSAANKVAIAGGTDGANVTEGVEIYDVTESGETVFGLTLTH